MLGFPDDSRRYDAVASILKDLNIQSVQLLTNNPRKIELLKELGIHISNRIPVIVEPNSNNLSYLQTKALKMNHWIDYSNNLSEEMK